MNALTTNVRPLSRLAYQAWTISPSTRLSYPVELTDPANLEQAVSQVMTRGAIKHKDTFQVLITDTVSGTGTLHLYYVKQSSKEVKIPHEDGTWRIGKPLVAEAVTSIEVRAFEPVEPWRWAPGADVVGVDRNVVRA